MPIEYINMGETYADLLDDEDLDATVNTVNCDGVMGKGIALQFKQHYAGTDMFTKYQLACKRGTLKPGMILPWRDTDLNIWVLHCATKGKVHADSRIEWIESICQRFVANYERLGITCVGFPPLGCGNGKLEWSQVGPLMKKYLDPLPIRVKVYLPPELWANGRY
jgi:O-acetyl-ADP-ribose deacetylase (regulator of RNase III)